MNRFLGLALAASIALAGCAAPGTSSPGSSGGTATTRGVARSGEMPDVAVSELRGTSVAALEAPADLWDRIRRGYAMPEMEGDLVTRHEQWYGTRPDYIERMVSRSRLYIFHIVEELELRGMPTELALLPYIESAFNPQAVSSAKAAGMWQFMPATGRDFQLRQNMFRDDRRNVLDSTRAALDYLQKLHDMFGDWHLALAAYNWGQGNVKRAIERNQAAGLSIGYMDLNMPAETRNYVPKLQAVKNIIANPQRYGTVLPLIENHPFFDTVDIKHDIDVETAARMAEVRVEDFKALNPSQRKPVIFAAGTPQILLPWNNAAVFQQKLAKADPASLASWTAWVAPSTLPSREVASRFGMDEEDFREMNNIPRGMVIKAGSTLLVRRAGQAGAVAESVVNNAHLAYTPEIVLKRTSVRARKGDSIATVAARYDLPAATVAGWNHTSARAGLKRGQAVVLFLPVRAAAAAAREGLEAARREQAEERRARASTTAAERKRDARQARETHGAAKRGRADRQASTHDRDKSKDKAKDKAGSKRESAKTAAAKAKPAQSDGKARPAKSAPKPANKAAAKPKR
ncbi:transglycosylase SLT domain-containing protein [Ottowia sp.]|uniref:transglycosylase SLT domain-containing protein n=1 Tax=Ottowia sp. TaxID=1898956 RepID=UPI002B6DAD5C|nr:transglycosylase SLT domain-containing protein [Ottowia sp.]HOB65315.1 transglycosylase SLT domain-containing protein [Ottowia sp.]HPZ58480.1 transglycosylase SLT domain-containing protein [Ottowia sp.]HQD47211.1 transglycosylase SLT domain-containing protein [Ottowia sp.]